MTTTKATPKIRRTLTIALIALATAAGAYSVFPFDSGGETLYLKWGDNHAGTPAYTVTWSFMPAGTPGDAVYCDSACPGISVGAINIENFPGGGFTLTPLVDLENHITATFTRWSAVAGIRFVKLPSDSGVAINDPAAVPNATGHIRIGAFNFGAGGGAVGFAPPPNGGTGAGDIIFDANSSYQFAPGAEGDAYDPFFAPNDFDTLLLHELGHALGLAHPVFDGGCPVMQVDPACFGIINRVPDADDIAGAQFLYGPAFNADFDGIPDVLDNCVTFPNHDQTDADGDGYGNRCDGDFNNDCVVNTVDLGYLKAMFFTADDEADLSADGIVNPIDLGMFKQLFFQPVGPSGLTSTCD